MGEPTKTFDEFAVVELMGHVKIAGRVTEEERFGAKLGRVDIPTTDGPVTQYFSGNSVYRITPCTEEIARAIAAESHADPIHAWDLRRQIRREIAAESESGASVPDADEVDEDGYDDEDYSEADEGLRDRY